MCDGTGSPRADGWRYTIRFRYDLAVVAAIKKTIPGCARSWDAQRRCWFVETDWVHVLAAELRRHGHTVIGVDAPLHHGSGWGRCSVHSHIE
jgi:hypothetical protein